MHRRHFSSARFRLTVVKCHFFRTGLARDTFLCIFIHIDVKHACVVIDAKMLFHAWNTIKLKRMAVWLPLNFLTWYVFMRNTRRRFTCLNNIFNKAWACTTESAKNKFILITDIQLNNCHLQLTNRLVRFYRHCCAKNSSVDNSC